MKSLISRRLLEKILLGEPDIDIRDLRKRVFLLAMTTLIILIINIFLTFTGYYSIYLGFVWLVPVFIGVFSLKPLFSSLVSYFRLRKSIEEETLFLVLLASVSPYHGNEIENVIEKLALSDNKNLFKGYRRFSLKIMNLARYTGVVEALRIISSIISSRTLSKILKNYLYSKSLGSEREYLSLVSEEMIRELDQSIKRETSLKTNIQAISIVLFTIIPIVATSLSRIANISLMLETNVIMISLAALLLLVTPGLPLILKGIYRPRFLVVIDGSVYILVILVLTSLILKQAILSNMFSLIDVPGSMITSSFVNMLSAVSEAVAKNLFLISVVLMILGLINVYDYVNLFRELQLAKELLVNSLSYVRIFKELGGFDLRRITGSKKIFRTWLLNYIVFSINYMRDIGLVIEELYERFVDKVLEIISLYKNYIYQNMIYVMLLFLQPYIFSRIEDIVTTIPWAHDTFLVSMILLSMITSKIMFDRLINGFLVSSTLILYDLLR